MSREHSVLIRMLGPSLAETALEHPFPTRALQQSVWDPGLAKPFTTPKPLPLNLPPWLAVSTSDAFTVDWRGWLNRVERSQYSAKDCTGVNSVRPQYAHPHQICTRSPGARYILSPGLTSKTSYHASILRIGPLTRMKGMAFAPVAIWFLTTSGGNLALHI